MRYAALPQGAPAGEVKMTAERDTYGHTPLPQMLGGDVYGIGLDAERAGKRPVRLGIIGVGGVCQSKYLPAIQRLRTLWEPVELTAVADPDEAQGRKVERIYNACWYRDHRELLEHEELDGVLVTSPDRLHGQHATDAIVSGRATLVEKPLTRSLVEGAALCRLADERGVPLLPVANMRFCPPHRRARGLVKSGAVPDAGMFVGKMNMGYGYVDLLEDATVHMFDLARFYLGDVISVQARADRRGRSKSGHPFSQAGVMLEFATGAIGLVSTSSTALSTKPWHRVEIYGSGAWLAVDDLYELTLYDDEGGPAKSWRPVMANTLFFDEEFGGYMGVIEHLLDVIRGEAEPSTTGIDGYRACELVAAAHLGVARATLVELPLDPEQADREVEEAWSRAGRSHGHDRSSGMQG